MSLKRSARAFDNVFHHQFFRTRLRISNIHNPNTSNTTPQIRLTFNPSERAYCALSPKHTVERQQHAVDREQPADRDSEIETHNLAAPAHRNRMLRSNVTASTITPTSTGRLYQGSPASEASRGVSE